MSLSENHKKQIVYGLLITGFGLFAAGFAMAIQGAQKVHTGSGISDENKKAIELFAGAVVCIIIACGVGYTSIEDNTPPAAEETGSTTVRGTGSTAARAVAGQTGQGFTSVVIQDPSHQ